ncbi:MAG: hypothetical protein Q9163_003938, partial [Psora crenata]
MTGEGGTSKISQAFANMQMCLAFKRIDHDKEPGKSEAEIFEMLTNEITVLGHPSIQEHPNIALLQGICWDITSDGKVWPVLVFEKSRFDDLYNFARRPVGKELDIHHRLKLCVEIGNAIMYMHSYNIIHGDVKPENVLIFKDHNGTFTARLIDFGYSTRYARDTDLHTMAATKPWNAPEHNRYHKLWTRFEAKKMDYFSFGMLCLWVLFEKDLSASTLSFRKTVFRRGCEVSCSSPEQLKDILQDSKADGKLPLLAQELVDAEIGLKDNERTALKEFFISVLDERQDRRDIGAGNLLKR